MSKRNHVYLSFVWKREASKKMQHSSDVIYVKNFLAEYVSSQTQGTSEFYKTKQVYNVNIFSQ